MSSLHELLPGDMARRWLVRVFSPRAMESEHPLPGAGAASPLVQFLFGPVSTHLAVDLYQNIRYQVFRNSFVSLFTSN